jgi:hypothetical protein
VFSLDDELLKIEIAKIQELLELKRLNLILMDITKTILTWVIDYCEKNNIPIWTEKCFLRLITIAQNNIKEIGEYSSIVTKLTSTRKLPPYNFDDRDPKELPEPKKENSK